MNNTPFPHTPHPYQEAVPQPPPWHGAPQPPEVANWGLRAVAYVIDVVVAELIFAAVLMSGIAVGLVLDRLGLSTGADTMHPAVVAVMVATLAAAFGLTFVYWWLPHSRSGRTVGKRLVGIRVIDAATGTSPSKLRALGRYLFMLVFSLPVVTFFLDCLWPLWDPQGQSLHDKVAGTYVIRG